MWDVRSRIMTWGCEAVRQAVPSTLFSAVPTVHTLYSLIEPRSIIEVESWERSWTSGGLGRRQQHLQAADTDDWRSILSCGSYFTRCVPVNWRTRGKRETARLTTQPQLPLQLGSTYQSTDKQWPAESKQWMSLFTFSDIPFTPECCHTLQWLISPIQAHCLNITH